MSNLSNAFKRKAFMPFITCGDPNLSVTKEIIYEMVKNGADAIELGIPFSDPMAEGVVIQKATERALKVGTDVEGIFQMVSDIRNDISIPLIFMTYANVVYSYGIEAFCKKMSELKVDGLILPDVSFEERDIFEDICKKYGIDFILFIAPTSKSAEFDRVEMISKASSGFIYLISSLGVTGVRDEIILNVKSMVEEIRSYTKTPICVGFGISTPAQALEMAHFADGVIIGSAIVQLSEKYGSDAPKHIGSYVAQIRAALDQVKE